MSSPSSQTDPVLLYEAKLAPKSKLPGERRAVAMAAGYLEASPPPLPGNAATRCARVLGMCSICAVTKCGSYVDARAAANVYAHADFLNAEGLYRSKIETSNI